MKERRIMLEGVDNCRDLGGITGREGTVRPGLLIRSAKLEHPSECDIERMKSELRLSKIIDLRTDMEREQRPDIMPGGVDYVCIPIFERVVSGITHEKEADGALIRRFIPLLEDLYHMMATEEYCRLNLGRAACAAMEHDFEAGSVLWHCSEGKDRCGLMAVVLLMALEVGRDVIMEDYLITNETNGPKADTYYKVALEEGDGEDIAAAIRDVYLAKAEYLNVFFRIIDESYGGSERRFLTEALAIPEATIDAFKKKALM